MNNMIPGYSTKLFTEIYEDKDTFLYDYGHIGLPKTISDANCQILYFLLYGKYGNSPIANFDVEQFKYKLFSVVWQYGPTWEKRLDVQSILRGLSLSDLIDDGTINDIFSHTGFANKSLSETGTSTGTSSLAHTGTVSDVHNNDIENSGSDTSITNHASNPETSPATNAFDPLGYINSQDANKTTKGTKSEQDESNTTTFNNTDTRTDNLGTTSSGTVTDNDTANDTNTKTLTAGKLKGYEKLLELLDTDVTAEFLAKFSICFKQFVLPGNGYVYVMED